MGNLIGSTPMIKIKYKYNNKISDLYVKLEQYNLTGSIKDRLALYIIDNAKEQGILKNNMPIIEATSGNTGISFAALGAKYNHPVYIFMPDWVSKERIDLMKIYGATVTLVSKQDGGFRKCIELADELAKKINGYRPNQFSNPLNVKCHYETTGAEIIKQLNNSEVGGFVSGVGTGGTIMGISRRIRQHYPNIVICAIEPKQMPLLTEGEIKGNHKIDGIGDDFIPDLLNVDEIDCVFDIDDMDAINMSRILSEKLGIGVGISSGANMLGSVLLQDNINKSVITVFPDDNKKYLTTDLKNDIDYNSDFISNKIELLEYSLMI